MCKASDLSIASQAPFDDTTHLPPQTTENAGWKAPEDALGKEMARF